MISLMMIKRVSLSNQKMDPVWVRVSLSFVSASLLKQTHHSRGFNLAKKNLRYSFIFLAPFHWNCCLVRKINCPIFKCSKSLGNVHTSKRYVPVHSSCPPGMTSIWNRLKYDCAVYLKVSTHPVALCSSSLSMTPLRLFSHIPVWCKNKPNKWWVMWYDVVVNWSIILIVILAQGLLALRDATIMTEPLWISQIPYQP